MVMLAAQSVFAAIWLRHDACVVAAIRQLIQAPSSRGAAGIITDN